MFTFVNMDLKDRIAAIIKVNKHSASSFADLIGIQRSSLSHILNGRNKPSLDFIQKVLTNFPNVDAKWLITGQEPSKEQLPLEKTKSKSVTSPVNPRNKDHNGDEIARIVVFFTDNTFKEYEPRK